MKLIESTKTTVTLKLSRTEFENLSMILGMALYMLVGARERRVVTPKDEEWKIAEAFLPKMHDLIQRCTRISIATGWLDEDDDEEDYE